MDINTLRSIATVVCFALFLGIVWWAYRGKNAERFHEAAMLPFALDDSPADEAGTLKEGKQR